LSPIIEAEGDQVLHAQLAHVPSVIGGRAGAWGSLDDFVGKREQGRRNFAAERICSFQIDD
jgi:hypothetical protein